MTLQELNDSFKVKSKARTSPTISPRQEIEEIRIKHVTNANRQTAIFDALREKVTDTLLAADTARVAAVRLKKKASDKAVVGGMVRQLESLVASLTTLQRKLA